MYIDITSVVGLLIPVYFNCPRYIPLYHQGYLAPVGTRRRFNVEAWLKFRRDVVSTLIQH